MRLDAVRSGTRVVAAWAQSSWQSGERWVDGQPLRRLTRMLGATIAVLVLLGASLVVAHEDAAARSRIAPLGASVVTVAGQQGAAGHTDVAPLDHLINPDVLVVSPRPLTATDIALISARTSATSTLLVSAGHVRVGQGTTEAVGVDPSTFRNYAPHGTAESTPLWRSVARGEIAVAHSVAHTLKVPLGGRTMVGRDGHVEDLRVGAYATTGLPGVGIIADQALDSKIGLVPGTGLIVAVEGRDPIITAGLAEEAVRGVHATATRISLVSTGQTDWVAPAIGRITSPFGPRDGHFHEGIDFGANFGAPIYAAAAGFILYAGPAPGFGNEVIIQHGNGIITVYGHMEQILVTSGPVRAGQPIALVGSEGESTGPHLHFEVHINDQLVDPLAWLKAHGVQFTS